MRNKKSLGAQRAQILGSMARHRKFMQEFEKENTNIYELKSRKEKLAQLWDKYELIQGQIECSENNGSEDEIFREEFEREYFALVAKTDEILEGFEELRIDRKEGANCARSENNKDRMQLPQVEIKRFSGKFDEWVPFYNLFKSMIHDNQNLDKLQKFFYLRSYLVDGAADVISDLELTPENYEEAWKLLKERYDNRRLIIQNHMKAIFETPAVSRENSVSLRSFVDCFKKHLRALKTLGSDAGESSDLLSYLVLSKMDASTVREWEVRQGDETKANINNLLEFLEEKCKMLEIIMKKPVGTQQITSMRRVQSASSSVSTFSAKCPICQENHKIPQCNAFKNLSPDEKYQKVLSKGLCMNCLKGGSHRAKDCFSPGCSICTKKHHELLHEKFSAGQVNATVACMVNLQTSKEIMLSTVKLEIFGSDGSKHNCRALLDCGSQSDFITENLVEKLGLDRHSLQVAVVGIGSKPTQTFERVEVRVKSRINNYNINLKPLILRKITDALPAQTFDKKLIKYPKNIVLADPEFNESGEIDLLIGAHHFWRVLNGKNINIKGQPRLQDTKFGWIIAGGWGSYPEQNGSTTSSLVSSELVINQSKTWEREEIDNPSELSAEEKYCVNHFEKGYKRDNTARFIVELPVKQEKMALLEDNKVLDLKRFCNLENRLNRNLKLTEDYVKFMREYENLGHMAEAPEESTSDSSGQNYYIPHHCIINENSLTTRLRVIFDASSKDRGSVSLNEALMTGSGLQQDLFSLLIRFRSFKYVLTADIKKMYRQIKIAEHQTSLQKIFWRENPNSKLKVYKLLTVTYGTASASFLTIKALQELAKWCTNVPTLLPQLDLNWKNGISFDKNSTFRTLSIKWWPVVDEFGYTVQDLVNSKEIVTKRSILSTIAKSFDPLGWFGPYIVRAKVLLQKLWELKLGWDDEVPEEIKKYWNGCLSQLMSSDAMKIPRLGMYEHLEIELHEFCDASWTDSKVVLAWLSFSSKKRSVFGAHRMGMMQNENPSNCWRHAPSEENPADLVSRGFHKERLKSVQLWWKGPEWLYNREKIMPRGADKLKDEEIPEMKRIVAGVATQVERELWKRYETYKGLVRVVVYWQRFIENCKYEISERTLIKIIQAERYSEELRLPQKSKLINLNPFLNENKILRVGIRLRNSAWSFGQNHPIILPNKHLCTRLLLMHEQERLLHTGTQTTLAVIMKKYWLVAVMGVLKTLVRNCIICRKAALIAAQHLMGSLPKRRAEYSNHFIEAILETSPVTPSSNHKRNYSCLTPPHFLVGDSLLNSSENNHQSYVNLQSTLYNWPCCGRI